MKLTKLIPFLCSTLLFSYSTLAQDITPPPDSLNTKINEITPELLKITNAINKNTEQINELINVLQESVKNNSTQLNSLNKELQQNVVTISDQVKVLNQEIQNINGTLQKNETKISGVEKNVQTIATNLSNTNENDEETGRFGFGMDFGALFFNPYKETLPVSFLLPVSFTDNFRIEFETRFSLPLDDKIYGGAIFLGFFGQWKNNKINFYAGPKFGFGVFEMPYPDVNSITTFGTKGAYFTPTIGGEYPIKDLSIGGEFLVFTGVHWKTSSRHISANYWSNAYKQDSYETEDRNGIVIPMVRFIIRYYFITN